MTVTRERFAQGMTYEAYKAQMTRNREQIEKNEQTAVPPAEDVAFFKDLDAPIHALVLAEDWCGDVINNVPVLARLAADTGKIDMRLFLRDQNLDIMDQYLKEGKYRSIPVFVLFDADFNELGHFIERPAVITELMESERAALFASDPALAGIDPATSPGELPDAARARVGQFFGEFRAQHAQRANAEVVKAVRQIVERGVAV